MTTLDTLMAHGAELTHEQLDDVGGGLPLLLILGLAVGDNALLSFLFSR